MQLPFYIAAGAQIITGAMGRPFPQDVEGDTPAGLGDLKGFPSRDTKFDYLPRPPVAYPGYVDVDRAANIGTDKLLEGGDWIVNGTRTSEDEYTRHIIRGWITYGPRYDGEQGGPFINRNYPMVTAEGDFFNPIYPWAYHLTYGGEGKLGCPRGRYGQIDSSEYYPFVVDEPYFNKTTQLVDFSKVYPDGGETYWHDLTHWQMPDEFGAEWGLFEPIADIH